VKDGSSTPTIHVEALLACEKATREGRITDLHRIARQWLCEHFPMTVSAFDFYVALSGPRDAAFEFALDIIAADGGERLMKGPVHPAAFTADGFWEVTLKLGGLAIPRAGTYLARLWINGKIAAETRLVFHQMPLTAPGTVQ
jgi:hypothetical protein